MNPELSAKPISKSKTVWGAVALVASMLLQQHDLASPGEASELATQIESAAELITALIGFFLVIYGRITAKRAIKLPG